MYPFPTDFDARQFQFAELEMVCFVSNSMYLHFGRNLMLTVECDFEHCETDTPTGTRSTFPLSSSRLMQLVGSRVIEAKVSEKADLSLRFESGAVLRIYPDAAYESYRIKQDGREFIV
jgi:hypothetical protein